MRTVTVVGARPNFVKMIPVLVELRRSVPGRHALVHTGQHYDRMMSEALLDDLGAPEPDHRLEVGSGSHAEQTARAMERLERVICEERPDLVLAGGDVNSTLAAALVAAKLRIPSGHVEAGLRSLDRSMPEEINRVVADELAALLFAHSDEGVENLAAQGIREGVHLVGNTMIDSLVAIAPRARALGVAAGHGLERGGFLLVTLHRPALVDGPLLGEVLARLGEVAGALPVLFPVHPRTARRISGEGLAVPAGVRCVEPVGYAEFLSLEADAAAVLTDSGGVQEETTYLGVPCFTLRAQTERPVTVRAGTNAVLGLSPERISELPALLAGAAAADGPPPLWDGRAAERVAAVVARFARSPREVSRPLALSGPPSTRTA